MSTPGDYYKQKELEAQALSYELTRLKELYGEVLVQANKLEMQIKVVERRLEEARYVGD